MDSDQFGIDLILGEEQERYRSADVDDDEEEEHYLSGTPETAKQTVVMERTDFEASSDFVIGDDAWSFPLWGVGRVENIILVTAEADYSITVDVDTTSEMVGQGSSPFLDDEAYDDLTDYSTELSSVAAYENEDSDNVLVVGPIDFLDSIRAHVSPDTSLTVKRMRAEVTLERSREKV